MSMYSMDGSWGHRGVVGGRERVGKYYYILLDLISCRKYLEYRM